MANTTNFGWETPDDTDLVKDGAAAMRTLGNAIDTSLVDLKGGTTDQVLAKNSNTDMDFKWVTSDDANAIQNAIVDAKGDLIAASAADTPARLAVGNNGETLVANSSASVGLSWNPPVGSLANPVINGGFDIWQRGTSFTSPSNTYTADRWSALIGATAPTTTISRQSTTDTTNLANIQYCARVQRNSGQTNTGILYLTQSLENVQSTPFIGKTITLSFYARAGANYSSASNALGVVLASGTGTDQNINGGFTGSSNVINQTATLTTTWQRFAYTGTIGATATQIGFYFNYTPVGTAGANDWFEVTGVQIDVGTWTASTAPTFRRAGGNIAGELAACQRYYYRSSADSVYATYGHGTGDATNAGYFVFKMPVTMRIEPASLDFNNIAIFDGTNIIAATGLTITSANSSKDAVWISYSATGAVDEKFYTALANNNTNSYVGVSAEL